MRNPRAVARMILADIAGLPVGASVTYETAHLRAVFDAATPDLADRPIEHIIFAALPGPEIGVWALVSGRGGRTLRIRRQSGSRGRASHFSATR